MWILTEIPVFGQYLRQMKVGVPELPRNLLLDVIDESMSPMVLVAGVPLHMLWLIRVAPYGPSTILSFHLKISDLFLIMWCAGIKSEMTKAIGMETIIYAIATLKEIILEVFRI